MLAALLVVCTIETILKKTLRGASGYTKQKVLQSAGVTCSNYIDTGALNVFVSGCLYHRLVILLVLHWWQRFYSDNARSSTSRNW